MEDRDITVEEQREVDRKMLQSAKKGETIIKVIVAIDVISCIFSIFVGTLWLPLRIALAVVSIVISLQLLSAKNWARILFMISVVVSLIESVISLVGISGLLKYFYPSLRAAIILRFVLSMAELCAYLYYMWFNKDVECFFRYKNSVRHQYYK